MTSSAVADRSLGRALDPTLPHMGRALDLDAAIRLFNERADAWGWGGFHVVDSSIHHVAYMLSERCTVTHRIGLQRGREGSETFVVADVKPGAVAWRPYHLDPEIPGLRSLSQPGSAARHLRHALGASESLQVEGISPLSFRSFSRCVLRFDVAGEPRTTRMIGKVVARPDQLGPPLDVIRSLAEAVPIVEPLARDVEHGFLVLPDLPGGELHDLVFASGVDLRERRSWMRALGSSLARLHGADAPLRVQLTAGDAQALVRFAPYLSRFAPGLRSRFDAAAGMLARLSAGERGAVPGHGAFRTDQAMIDGDEAVIVDLDRMCSSEPARDLGNCLAYLRWKAIRQPEHRMFIEDAEHDLLEGYAHERPVPDPERIHVHQAISMLKIAGRRLKNLDVDEWHLLEQLVEEAEEHVRRARDVGPTSGSRGTPVPAFDSTAPPPEALDRDLMSAAFEPLLGGAPGRVTGVEVLSARSGRRWTMRYRLSGTGQHLIGKVYADDVRGRWVRSAVGRLASTVEATSGPMGLPTVLGWLPSLSMMVSVETEGRDLADLLLDAAVPLQQPLGSAAAWLAALHTCGMSVDRTFSVVDERESVQRWALVVGERHPHMRGAADELARALDGRLAEHRTPATTAVAIHKDFHAQHVLISGEGVTAVDFDEMRMGEAAFDVAHFCAYAELLSCRYPVQAARIDRAGTSFVHAYGRHGGVDVPARSFDDFFAYTCLKIAWQLSIGAGLEPDPDAGEESRQAGVMLERGLLTLGRAVR